MAAPVADEMTVDPAARAARAERAVLDRSVRRLWGLPGTALGVIAWPPTVGDRLFLGWNYWWQAHLVDCLVDAHQRDPQLWRVRLIDTVARSVRVRNVLGWTNRYYDDMAWLGLALQRAAAVGAGPRTAVLDRLTTEMVDAWSDDEGGGIPWRRRDEFKNTPANGPAAILLARRGHLDRAAAIADWMDERLRDPDSGLIWDGLRPGQVEKVIYTYCQGVVLGAEVELAVRADRDRVRVDRLVRAIASHLTRDGVLQGHDGGDSGLFTGILARYLALVVTTDPGVRDGSGRLSEAARTAAQLVGTSADAAWANARETAQGPLFGPRWDEPARVPTGPRDRVPERDLSVQLSGWMLLEADAEISRTRITGSDR